MNLNSIEILAAILIIIAIVKVVIMILNPHAWLNLIERMYSIPSVISVIGFLLSVLVLYFIINSGITIVEILAVCLFIALLMITGLANYADEVIVWIREQDIVNVVKQIWLYSAMWLFLIVWGAYTLLSE
jgi:hypothetical protein